MAKATRTYEAAAAVAQGDGATTVVDPEVQYTLELEDLWLDGALTERGVTIQHADALDVYATWEPPVVIVSDGGYGIGGFVGDPPTPEGLPDWYRPHVEAWSKAATPETTLWFWNTELGWATVHPLLVEHSWTYRCCHVWDKGIAHVAGNSNTQRLRKLPVVTEVCVQYVKEPEFTVNGRKATMQAWLRHEWERSRLPLYKTNEACNVKNAATRKYFTKDHLWYFPPPEAFEQLAAYANERGNPAGRPYFSLDGERPIPRATWARMRAKFNCPLGVTNVWQEPAMRGQERVRWNGKILHTNQKPLRLIERIIRLSSDEGDVVWEPFGGLCSAAIAALRLNRRAHAAEMDRAFYETAARRLRAHARRLAR